MSTQQKPKKATSASTVSASGSVVPLAAAPVVSANIPAQATAPVTQIVFSAPSTPSASSTAAQTIQPVTFPPTPPVAPVSPSPSVVSPAPVGKTTTPIPTLSPSPISAPANTPISAPANTPIPAPANTPIPAPTPAPIPAPLGPIPTPGLLKKP